MGGRGWVGQDQGAVAQQAQPMTLTKLQLQASWAVKPEDVLKVLQDADGLLDSLRASTKASPQLDKQVAGVHALLHSFSLRLLPAEQQQDAAASTSPSIPPQKGLQLSMFHGLQLARMLRLLGKSGSTPPVAVQEGILRELLADDCQKLLTASPLAWVQVLQGMHLIRGTWDWQQSQQQHQQGQAGLLHKGPSHEPAQQDGGDGWASPLTWKGEAGSEASLSEGARTVHSPQLADLEHDLKEVISSMLISAAEHIEPNTVVMVGHYLARVHTRRKEVFEAVSKVVASNRHRMSDKTISLLGMLARSLTNPPQMHVPLLLDQLAALVMEKNTAHITSQGWPDLLRAFSQHSHPCPGLMALLADSADCHVPHMSFPKLSSLATSVMLLEPHTPQGLRLLQAICAAVPAKVEGATTKNAAASRMLHALAATRVRDPACLQPLLATTTAAWLPQLTALAESAQHHAAAAAAAAAADTAARDAAIASDTAARDAAIASDAAAQSDAFAADAAARDAVIASDTAVRDAASHDVAADAGHAPAAPAASGSAPAAPTTPDQAAAGAPAPSGTAPAAVSTPSDHEPAAVPTTSDQVSAAPASSGSVPAAETTPTDPEVTAAPTPSDQVSAAPASSGSVPAAKSTPTAQAAAAIMASMTRASALADAMYKSAPPRAADAFDAAWKTARPASLLTHMHNTPFQQLLPPLATLADVGVLSKSQSACLADALAMSLAAQQPKAYTSTNSGIGSSSSSSSSSSHSGSTGVDVGSFSHASYQQAGAGAESDATIEAGDGCRDGGGGGVGDDGQVARHGTHSTASQADMLLSFVHSALQGPPMVGGNLESFKVRCGRGHPSSPEEEDTAQSLFGGAAFDGSNTKSSTGVHSYWSLPAYRQLMAHSLAMVRALGLGDALYARRGVHGPPHAGLPAYLKPWMGAMHQPAKPDIQFVSALLGGHTSVQEVLYRVPSEPQEQEHSSSHAAQLGLQGGDWEVASEAMRLEEGSEGEGSREESSSKGDVLGSSTIGDSQGDEEGSSSSDEDGSSSSGSSSSSDSDEEESSSSKKDDKWSAESQAGSNEDTSVNKGASDSGGDTGGTEGMAALESLLLRAGTRQSEDSYKTLMLASTLSSVLLGQGLSSPTMQQLLVADGRLVIAGAVHQSSWAASGLGSSSSEHEPKGIEGSGSSGSIDKTSSSSATLTSSESRMPHAMQQGAASPVAVLLLRPEDFCQPLPNATEPGSSKGSRTQQQQLTPMGDLVLRRWLLRAAGVRVVEVAEAEWAAVMKHEAAASLLISEALQQQQQQQQH